MKYTHKTYLERLQIANQEKADREHEEGVKNIKDVLKSLALITALTILFFLLKTKPWITHTTITKRNYTNVLTGR